MRKKKKKEKEQATSSCSSSSPGVWVLPEEYTGSSPSSPHCLVYQWVHVPALFPEAFGDEFHTFST